VIDVPVVGTKTFSLPAIMVEIPAVTAPMDLGTHAVEGGHPLPAGDALARVGGCSGNGTDPTDPTDPPAGECTASTAPFTPTWHPPAALYANACTFAQIDQFFADCRTETATQAACDAFRAADETCMSCLVSSGSAQTYGAFVVLQTYGTSNVAGCIARIAPEELSCAKTLQAYDQCIDTTCASCTGAAQDERSACFEAADAGVCAGLRTEAEACMTRLEGGPTEVCWYGGTAELFCGPPP
jgi:hypothetical protein